MLDLVKKKQLLVQLSCGQKTATEKENTVRGSFRQEAEPEKNRFLYNELVYHFLRKRTRMKGRECRGNASFCDSGGTP